jgi:CHAT domain-containing protein
LGIALIERFHRTINSKDLIDGIAAHRRAVKATVRGSAGWVTNSNGLGAALRARFLHTRDHEDLNRAIEIFKEVLNHVEPGSPDRAGYLINLSSSLTARYKAPNVPGYGGQVTDRDDVVRAASASQEAVRLLPSGVPGRATALKVLAGAMAALYFSDGDPAQLRTATEAWREGCLSSRDASQPETLQGALNWCETMVRCGDWATAVEAFEIAQAAADNLLRLQLTREHQNVWLEESNPLHGLGAYALARLGRLEEAVITLEGGRATFLSKALSLDRANLDRLSELGHGRLYDAYCRAESRLAGLDRAGPGDSAVSDARRARQEARAARTELEQAIAAIRTVPGYEAFLAPATYAEIAAAAAGTVLAYVTATREGGFALLVDGRVSGEAGLSVIWLDGLTEWTVLEMFQEFRREYLPTFVRHQDPQGWQESLDRVTRQLWDTVLGPVLDASQAERLTLIPGGRHLDLLPLHAAWREDASSSSGRRYALDQALITYAPSARALQSAHQHATRPAKDILAVFDPALNSAERETQRAKHWFSAGTIVSKDQMTRKSLQDMLPKYSVLHFSCHGSADLIAPLESCLAATSDRPLTLRDILKQPLGARLAVLSACETAIAGGSVPDQAVSLPTGFIQAGAAGVVGSLWPVNDFSTLILIAAFYDLWQRSGLAPAQALRAAQQWFRDQRSEHPAHWAAFIYVGA